MLRKLLVALSMPCAALAETPADRWNLADIYATEAAWQEDARRLEGQFEEMKTCRGQLGESSARFKACMDLNTDLYKRFRRLSTYASETFAENTAAPAGMELRQKARLLGSRTEESVAFVRPEILALGSDRVARLLAGDAALAIYRRPLDVVLRNAPHTLDDAGESMAATFGLATSAPESVYTTLSNADMLWPSVKLSNGQVARLDQSGYTKYRAVANRADRKKVFDTFWRTWKDYERTFGVTFHEMLKTDSAYAKVRRYPDSITRKLDPSKIPSEVYDTLIAQTNANLPTLHRYFKLRAKLLGVRDMRYYDIYPPLVNADRRFPLELGKRMMLESLAPLGADYVAVVERGLKERWMDTYPRPQKLSGAHVNGGAYDVHPFVLMNYNDDYESVETLAHEWGHAMHSHLANKAQPFVTAGYATFTAEIASTLNEALLLEHALKTARNDDERLLYLGSALENLRGTFFRQAMFAEFEREVHARADRHESLIGPSLTKLYGEILRRYHGHDQGVVKIDDLYAIEWAYIPHFYSSFYVFQYATSVAASALLAERILKGEPGAKERYLDLLRAGGSDDPYLLVKAAGVDLATPAPYQALVARMNQIMDEIEAIQARRAKSRR
jgi:oligoendopeptidase F